MCTPSSGSNRFRTTESKERRTCYTRAGRPTQVIHDTRASARARIESLPSFSRRPRTKVGGRPRRVVAERGWRRRPINAFLLDFRKGSIDPIDYIGMGWKMHASAGDPIDRPVTTRACRRSPRRDGLRRGFWGVVGAEEQKVRERSSCVFPAKSTRRPATSGP